MLDWLKRIFSTRFEKPKGILLYGTVQEVILVHKMLAAQGYRVKLVAPPPEIFTILCSCLSMVIFIFPALHIM